MADAATYLISIAGSAGAFGSLRVFLAALPDDCPAAVVVALHSAPGSVLVDAIRPSSRMPVDWARSGVHLARGHVYVAPPDQHLVVNPDARVTLSKAARIRWFRPSADWLFESGAASFGARHAAVVLSGMLSDGSLKLKSVRRHGGRVFVQDPATCRYPAMPYAAIATRQVDQVLPIETIASAVTRMFSRRDHRVDSMQWNDPFAEPANRLTAE